ncbi:MAG: hypothetical protein ABI690_30410 [Chloroflexota bacterium]
MSKLKRKSKLVEYELLPHEEILWLGSPVQWKLFTAQDVFLIPFSLFWCSIAIPLLISGFRSGNLLFILLPHGWIGLYMLFGRFIYKIIRNRHTTYVITNERILMIYNLLGKHVQTHNLDHLPHLGKVVGIGGIGNITFDDPAKKSRWNRRQTNYSNTGMDIFGQTVSGFYDIRDVEEVYHLLLERTYQPAWDVSEKQKPAYQPR